MRLWCRLDTPRRVAAVLALALVFVGTALFALALDRRVTVPMVPPTSELVPTLEYVRSLPDAGEVPFLRPVGLAVGDGLLYVADSEAATVRVFTTSGFGAGTVGQGVLDVPAYLAADEATGTLLVTDRGLGAVLRFDAAGKRMDDLVPSTEATATWAPLAVAVDGAGTVAVSDSAGRQRLLVMNRSGEVEFSLGGSDPLESPGSVSVALDYPNCVALSESDIWVSDSNNRRVLRFDRSGAFRGFVAVDGIARGLAFIASGAGSERFVAIADALTSEIVLVTEDGTAVTRYGSPGSAAGQLAYPNDVAYDEGTSRLFVADTGNARVQVWDVVWPSERTGVEALAKQLRFTPIQVFGMGLALAGLAVGAAALTPRRRRHGTEPATVENTL